MTADRSKYAAIWNNMFQIAEKFFDEKIIASDYERYKLFNHYMQKLLSHGSYPMIEKAYIIFIKCLEENIVFKDSKEFFGKLWKFFLKYAMNENFTEEEKHNIFKDIEEFNERGLEPVKDIKAKFVLATVDEIFEIHKNIETCNKTA